MKWTLYIALLFSISFIGCIPEYQIPQKESTPDDYEIVVNESFDSTWTSIIEHASSTYFAIDTYEKDSGLMTLDFGAKYPSEFIDCGNITIPLENYEGSFVLAAEKFGDASLNGKMNIFVKSLSANTTQVIVSARYVFTAKQKNKRTRTWIFNTGGKDVSKYKVGSTKIKIVCQPTYEAEHTILNIFKSR